MRLLAFAHVMRDILLSPMTYLLSLPASIPVAGESGVLTKCSSAKETRRRGDMFVDNMVSRNNAGTVPPGSSIRAIDQSDLSEEPDSLIKEPNFKIIYNFLIKDKGQNLIK
jgi:hypothetical protein